MQLDVDWCDSLILHDTCQLTWQNVFDTSWYFVILDFKKVNVWFAMTPWPSDTGVLQVLPQSWRVPSQARSEHFGHFNFHQMWPHSVWPLCLTLADLETFVWHDLGSFKCQACQVYHFVRSSKLFSTLDLLKIQNCRNICSESITRISTHIPDKILRKLFPIESQARPWWSSSASGWDGWATVWWI